MNRFVLVLREQRQIMDAPNSPLDSLFSPEFIADPYPIYRAIRETTPFVKMPDTDMWLATRYEDCQHVLKDKRFGHLYTENLIKVGGPEILDNAALRTLSNMMLVANPPDHTRLRSLVVKAFDRRGIEKLRGRIRDIANQLIDGFIDQGSGDLVRLFNHPLPVIVICDLLGIPEADQARFTNESQISGRLIDPTPMTPEELEGANEGTLETEAYFISLFEARRKHGQDDLLTALVESETEHGKLTKEELAANVFLLFGAGHETTVNLLGNALLALYRNPDQLDILRNDLTLLPNAVEEFLRYDSSVQLTARNAFEDCTIAGADIKAGDEVMTIVAAANRDPDMFDDPERLDVRRPNVKPLAFGGGIHFCLGAQLARLETAEGLKALFERLPDLQLDNVKTPAWKETITLRGLTELPAHW
jgi:hypothetical protein